MQLGTDTTQLLDRVIYVQLKHKWAANEGNKKLPCWIIACFLNTAYSLVDDES